jgi:hypothetical protein
MRPMPGRETYRYYYTSSLPYAKGGIRECQEELRAGLERARVGPEFQEGEVSRAWGPLVLPTADFHLSASLSWISANRGRIGSCSRGWGWRGTPRGTPGLHLCHLGHPEDHPPLRAPWSVAAGAAPRGTICRLHSAASSLFPSLSGP